MKPPPVSAVLLNFLLSTGFLQTIITISNNYGMIQMAVKKFSLFIILVLIACMGVFILPSVAATSGTTYKMNPVKLPANQVNRSPIDYSYLFMPFGFSPHVVHIECDDNGNCYDANSIACGSCGTVRPSFPTIQYTKQLKPHFIFNY
jgi:hypothetical protein